MLSFKIVVLFSFVISAAVVLLFWILFSLFWLSSTILTLSACEKLSTWFNVWFKSDFCEKVVVGWLSVVLLVWKLETNCSGGFWVFELELLSFASTDSDSLTEHDEFKWSSSMWF